MGKYCDGCEFYVGNGGTVVSGGIDCGDYMVLAMVVDFIEVMMTSLPKLAHCTVCVFWGWWEGGIEDPCASCSQFLLIMMLCSWLFLSVTARQSWINMKYLYTLAALSSTNDHCLH